MTRQRIALVISSLDCGGAERALSQLANAWVEAGLDVTLVTWYSTTGVDFYPLDQRVERISAAVPGREKPGRGRLLRNLQTAWRLRQVLRRLRPVAVLSFMDATNVLCVVATAGLRTRLVVAERTDPSANFTLPPVWHRARRLLYRYADVVTAQTVRAARWLDEHCGVRTQVIANYVRQLPPVPPAVERQPLLLCVGRLVSEKGFDTVLRALHRISTRHEGWRIVFLGEGPERASLERLAHELGLANRVSFRGVVADVPAWMARSSVLVMASRFEGFPNALLEGMAMGMACISTDCPSGPADLIENDVNGRLVPVDDVDTLAAALDAMMSDPALRERLGERAEQVRVTHSLARILPLWSDAMGLVGVLPENKSLSTRDST